MARRVTPEGREGIREQTPAEVHEDEVNALAERMYAIAAPGHRSSGKTLEFLAQDCFEAARVFLAFRKQWWTKRSTQAAPAVGNKPATISTE